MNTAAERSLKRLGDPPLISVITVVYNGAEFIVETMMSLLHQTFDNFEYVIIDGGSSDQTLQKIDQFKSYIDLVVSEPDKGIYDAMNKGILCSKGTWVYFLNCQDAFFDRNTLLSASRVLKNCATFVFAGVVQVRSGKSFLTYPEELKGALTSRGLFKSKFCHQALFVKRSAYIEYGLFDLKFKVFADFALIYRIIANTGGYSREQLNIAKFDLSGVSSDWRRSVSHYVEQEAIFALHNERRSIFRYYAGYVKAFFYFIRKGVTHRLSNL
jgi:glycosyltransferase involved in cell wall biosynthesis